MFRNARSKFDLGEYIRKGKRCLDWNLTYKKIFFILLCFTFIFLYVGSSIFRFLFRHRVEIKDPLSRCMDDRLTPFYLQNSEFNANIRHNPSLPEENSFIPYVGNGYFGIEIQSDAYINIKKGRALGVPIYFHPFVSLSSSNGGFMESTVVEYNNAIVHRFQCFQEYYVSYQYFAHRNMPSLFIQELEITNTKNQIVDVDLTLPRISDWPSAVTQDIKIQHGSIILEYQSVTGTVISNSRTEEIIVISIVYKKLPRTMTLKKRGVTKLEILISIQYSQPIKKSKFHEKKREVEKRAIESIKAALQEAQHEDKDSSYYNLKKQHINVWNNIWATGFSISTSKAEHIINGDRINATMYAVLCHARTFEFEESITPQRKQEIERALTYADGCYDSYHTLQAENLWLDMSSLDELNNLVSSWMLTLEKQGCHNLLRAGASGVIQAMVLSFGSFRFSNQHLELNIHPKYLHREYNFRRLNYGNMTHVNVSISVTDENKAIIYVALDRSDRSYYACDAGCLDEPVLLGPSKKIFPVKLTEPITAILYITADKQHMEELHKAIHVKEVVEAPAHEHHVIALHKHGHHLGGLPTLFWVSICAIIIIFHVFLCKLIVKEYCEPPDKLRYRYSKP